MARPEVVDVDNPVTWPQPVADWVRDWVEHPGSLGEMSTGLIEREGELLAGQKVLTYHCTRLLDGEVAAIRRDGLRELSSALIADRIEQALAGGFISDEEAAKLGARHVFALDAAEHREGQVCLILGRSVLDQETHGCAPLLETWGGEGIYWGARELEERLREIGRPSIVVAGIDLERAWTYCLARPFVGSLSGNEWPGADIFYRAAVLPEDVLEIWQPGVPEYDRHTNLPQS